MGHKPTPIMTKPSDLINIVTHSFHRRAFLQGAAATALFGCGGDDSSPSAPTPDAAVSDGGTESGEAGPDASPDAGSDPDVPFGLWKEVRSALRTSPDHLAAQARELVEQGDPEDLFTFVRDRFLTLPDGLNQLGGLTKRRWGLRGTLRSGSGSLRDKADLLADLYRQAGLDAEVLEVRTPNDTDFVPRVLRKKAHRPFAPVVDDATLARWREHLGLDSSPTPADVIDPDHAEAATLASQLLSLLPDAQTTAAFSLSRPGYMPIVAVQVDGVTRYANVAEPDILFGETGGEGDPRPTDPAEPLPDVHVRLSMVTTASPKDPIEIVSATWPMDEVIGRQVSIAMVPPEDALTLMSMRFRDVRTFIPALSLQGPDLTEAQRDTFTVAIKAITVAGEVLEVDGDTVTYQGNPIDTGDVDPSLVARVTSLETEVIGSTFPDVRVRAAALDAQGASVQGLTAAAFTLEEEGAPQRFQLLESRAAPPRVLFVLDQSSSLPAAFLGEQAAALLRSIAEDVLDGEPAATFRVHMVGGKPADGTWTSDPAALELAALTQSSFGSALWGALAQAAAMQPTTVVMVTDGVATDAPDVEIAARLSQLPPCVFLGVGQATYPVLDEMAERTAGEVYAVEAQAEASEAALSMIRARQKSTYLFRYLASEQGPQVRAVRLALLGSGASSEGSYEVPAVATQPPRIGGLILDIEIPSVGEVRQVIAGLPEVPEDASSDLFDQVHAAMFGSAEVRFEGAPPTLSAMIDDLLSARLSLEPLWNAVQQGEPETIVETFLQGFDRFGATALALSTAAGPSAESVVFPSGLRAVLTTAQPRYGVGLVRRISLVPLGGYRAAEPDRRVGLEAAVRATARHALLEAGLYETSTVSELAGQPLIALNPFSLISSAIPTLTAEQREAWTRAMAGYTSGYRIVPASGSPVAFWYVDRSTGALLGVLADGSGGGSTAQEIQKLEAQLTNVLNWVNAIGGYFGMIGMAGGVWISLEKAKLKKLMAATLAIATMEAPVDIGDFSGVVADVACDAIKGAAGEVFGVVGEGAGSSILRAAASVGTGILQADAFVEAGTGTAPISCT